MIEDQSRLLQALAVVRAAGSDLEPVWDSGAPEGVLYQGTGSQLDDFSLLASLDTLAGGNYLQRKFVDRISLCPTCGSHALNFHEACLSCGSSNLSQIKVLLHFRCGFVGPVSAFKEEHHGRRCPTCHKVLHDLGTDHDSPGDYFACHACNANFQLPEPGARCLSCGARFSGVDMHKVRYRDVFSYRLTALGAAALEAGRLLEAPHEALHDTDRLLYRRNVILGLIEDQRRLQLREGANFGLIVVGGSSIDDSVAAAIKRVVDDTAKLGRLDAHHLIVLLPDTTGSRTKSAMKQILSLELPAEIVELAASANVERELDGVAGRMYQNV
ncbi:MAG: hypothetical protein ACRENA_06350 [Vulcanimicrobiaceae bacterium]